MIYLDLVLSDYLFSVYSFCFQFCFPFCSFFVFVKCGVFSHFFNYFCHCTFSLFLLNVTNIASSVINPQVLEAVYIFCFNIFFSVVHTRYFLLTYLQVYQFFFLLYLLSAVEPMQWVFKFVTALNFQFVLHISLLLRF